MVFNVQHLSLSIVHQRCYLVYFCFSAVDETRNVKVMGNPLFLTIWDTKNLQSLLRYKIVRRIRIFYHNWALSQNLVWKLLKVGKKYKKNRNRLIAFFPTFSQGFDSELNSDRRFEFFGKFYMEISIFKCIKILFLLRYLNRLCKFFVSQIAKIGVFP